MPYQYPGDYHYTHQALLEDLGLMERHIRDGSWRGCTCIPEKHLPLISGLTSEGYIFAKSPEEKQWMANVRDKARTLKQQFKTGNITSQTMNEVADWTRTKRHELDRQTWNGSNINGSDINIRKSFNNETTNQYSTYNGETSLKGISYAKQAMGKDTALIYGGEIIGTVTDKILTKVVDPAMPAGLLGQPVSTILRVVGAVAAPFAAVKIKNRDYKTIVLLVGGQLLTGLLDSTIDSFIPSPVTAVLRYTPAQMTVNNVPLGQGALGKYT